MTNTESTPILSTGRVEDGAVEDVLARTFFVDIIAERYRTGGEEDVEQLDSERIAEGEPMEDLARVVRERGLSTCDAIDRDAIYLRSEVPEENRAYFEQGLHTYYKARVRIEEFGVPITGDVLRELATDLLASLEIKVPGRTGMQPNKAVFHLG